MFSKCFRFLTAMCFGLLISAFNDSYALFSGYASIGSFSPFVRYLFVLSFIIMGLIYATFLEKKDKMYL